MVPARYRNNPFTPMNSLLEEFFGDMIPERTTQAGFRPPLDLREDEGHFYAQLELPGMSKEEVKISIEDSVLTVRGEKKKQELLEKGSIAGWKEAMVFSNAVFVYPRRSRKKQSMLKWKTDC